MGNPVLRYEDIKIRKRALTKSTWIITDTDLADRYDQAEARLRAARGVAEVRPSDTAAAQELVRCQDEVDRIREEVREQGLRFEFKAIGRKRWEELLNEHPATKEQTDKAKKQGVELPFNEDTFPMAVMSESIVSPELSAEEIKEIWDSPDWNSAELLTIWNTCLEVNNTRRVADLGKD